MRTKLIAILVAGLFAEGTAWADENFVWGGSIGLGGRWADVEGDQRNGAFGTSGTTVQPFTGPRDEAKANEYRDLSDGVITTIDVRGTSRNYWLNLFGENFGFDDQFVDVRGGGYGAFSGQFYWDKIPHNLSWNALTPLSNPGGTLQTFTGGTYPQAQNPALWNSFNYWLQRDTIGGNLELSLNTPWFIRADYNEVEMSGVRPQSGQLGTGSGNGLIEFGAPVDYKTKNTTIEAGYTGETWNVKLGFFDSRFDNGQKSMQWTNFYLRSQLDTSLLPQDTEWQKWSLNASVRQLPLDSTLMFRATYSELSGDFAVDAAGLKPTTNASPPVGAGYLVTTPSSSTFNGEHKTTTASIALASHPASGWDTRLFYDYYDKDNNSTPIDYAAGGLGPAAATCPNPGTGIQSSTATRFCISAADALEPFSYTKNYYGFDVSYRLAPRQKLLGGANFLNIERDLEIAEETDERKYWIEYRNSMLSDLSGRLKYQYMERRSDINHNFTPSGTASPTGVPFYYSAYDVANLDQNMIKANLDWSPLPLLSMGFGVTWKDTEYKDLYYGRTDDTTTLYDLSVSYGDPNHWRVTALGNWGEVEFNQAYRNIASGQSPLPGGPQTATTFDWGTENTQEHWLVALMGEWQVNERLKLMASYSYQETDGGVNFWSGNYEGQGGFNGGPLVNYVTDNTKTQRFHLKGDYRINRNWSATAGYAYESYDYADDQMRGYQGFYPYYQNLGSTNNSWFSGAFANPGYTAHIVYVMGKYVFD